MRFAIALGRKKIAAGEEAEDAAGVYEDGEGARAEAAGANRGDGASHGFGSVGGIEEDAFQASEEFDGFESGGVGDGVAFADEAIEQFDGGLIFFEAELVFGDGAALEVAKIFFEEIEAVADGDAQDAPVIGGEEGAADHQAGEGAGRADGGEDVDLGIFSKLLDQLVHAADVAPAAEGSGCADGEKIGAMAGFALGGHGLIDQLLLVLVVFLDGMQGDVRAQHAVEEKIAVVGWIFLWRAEEEAHAQAEACADGGGDAAVIGLEAAVGDERVCALIDGVGDDVFELADFVAGGFQAGEVVALEENAIDVEVAREIVHLHQRSGKQGEGNSRRLTFVHQLPR